MKGNLKIVLLSFFMLAVLFFPQTVKAEDGKKIDILFTSDMHSHFNSFKVQQDDEIKTVGGFARIKTELEKRREKNPATLTLDGGDFSMGTLVQSIYETDAAELRMLGELGIEATTIGNHEFDYRSKGLSNMLHAAVSSGDTLPQMLICNIDWEAMEEERTEGQAQLIEAFETYGVSPYTIIEKEGIKIAVIGVFGKDALSCAPTCELPFKDPVLSVKETVKTIQETENADMLVCISHGGTSENPKKSEDEILAKEVPELDLIISGHTHTELFEPIISKDTVVAACGEYGKNLGAVSFEQKENGRWKLNNYELIPIDETIEPNKEAQEKIDAYYETVNETYLSDFGYKTDDVLAWNPYVFSDMDQIYEEHTEHNLGSIIADAYFYAASHAKNDEEMPVSVTVAPSGTIRETYVKGELTVEDIFDSFSLGIGADGKVGYPLLAVYLTGEELKTMAEIDASVSDFMSTARLYCSGIGFTFDTKRLPLNKVTDVWLIGEDGERIEIEDDKLYRVSADLYSGQMLGAVSEQSAGLLSVTPKFADGTPIENMEDAILYDGNDEVKAWYAIASYMESFEKNENGLPQIPERYNSAQGRKIVVENSGFFSKFRGLNKFGAIILTAIAVVVLLIALIAWLVVWVVKRRRRRRR